MLQHKNATKGILKILGIWYSTRKVSLIDLLSTRVLIVYPLLFQMEYC